MAHNQLTQEIVRLSKAKSWDLARLEWRLATVYFADEAETCLCGHFPIRELCVLRNSVNDNEAVVGNHCVKKFLRLPSDLIFTGLKKVQGKVTAALNPAAIDYAHRRGWINDWEFRFYMDTWRKRELSGAQASKRREINEKVLQRVAADSRPASSPRKT